jgi:chromosome segregation ATPase
LANDLKAT